MTGQEEDMQLNKSLIKFIRAIGRFIKDFNTFCDVYIEEITEWN